MVYPIDYANACPDVAITSLHYYFPWAMKALVKWSVFCTATGRRPRYDLDTRRYFDIADRADLDYAEKLAAYRRLADDYFEVERYADFCASRLAPSRRGGRWSGSRARTSTGCSSTRSARRSRRTSTTTSSRTTAGCSARGRTTSATALERRWADGSADRPGVHRLVGVHVLDVAAQHLSQGVAAIQRLLLVVDAVEGARLPLRAVLVGDAALLDDAEQPVADRGVDTPRGEALRGRAAAAGAARAR